MTREETIRIFRKEIECLSHAKCEDCILEKVCDPAKTTPLDSEYIEAYGMAIQALSQEPCERFEWGIDGNVYKITKAKDGKEICQQVCDDAISRDWLKTAIHNFYYGLKHTPSEEDIQAYIDAAPFVTQKPTEGDDTVSRGVFEQVMRERDIAIEQLHELGYELGQKVEPLEVEAAKLQQAYNKGFEDCRQAVLDLINADWEYEGLEVPVNSLLPVTQNPETVTEFADRCRECRARYGKLLEQKSGKWIPIPYELDYETDAECSLCHEKFIAAIDYDYCPKCGYRMQKSEDK